MKRIIALVFLFAASIASGVEIQQKFLDLATRMVLNDLAAILERGNDSRISLESVYQISGLSLISNAAIYHQDFDGNEIAAENKYKGKKFVLFGNINSINKDIAGRGYLVLATGQRGFDPGVHAVLANDEMQYAASLNKGAKVYLVCESSTKIGPTAFAKNCKGLERFLNASDIDGVFKKFITGRTRLKKGLEDIEDLFVRVYAIINLTYDACLQGWSSQGPSNQCVEAIKNMDREKYKAFFNSLAEQLGVAARR